MEVTLHTAANGHLTLNLNGSPENSWSTLSKQLVNEYGFKRSGKAVVGFDERIQQDFERSEFKLAAGWDNWSGHYLLSGSAAGDDFLKKLYDEFSKA
jgi:hypothetical protein